MDKDALGMLVSGIDKVDWEYKRDPVAKVTFRGKTLYKNPETGLSILYSNYPKGYCKPPHHHTYGQGIFVLKGDMLANGARYHPGDFVWFPAGSVGTHGATDEEDLYFLVLNDCDGDLIYD